MDNQNDSNEDIIADEVQFLEERVSRRSLVNKTYNPTTHALKLLQQPWPRHEKVVESSSGNETLNNYMNLVKDIADLQKRNQYLSPLLKCQEVTTANLEAEKLQLRTEFQQLQQQKQQQQIKHEEMIKVLSENLKKCSAENNDLKNRLSRERVLKANIESSAQLLKRKLQRKVEELDKQKATLDQKCKEFGKVSFDLDNAIAAKNAIETKYINERLAMENNYNDRMLELEKEKEELRSAIEEQTAIILSSSVQLNQLSANLQQAQNHTKVKTNELTKAEEKLTEVSAEIIQLKKANMELQNKLNTARHEEIGKQRWESKPLLHKLTLEDEEKEFEWISRYRKRPKIGGGNCGGSKKICNDTVPVSSDSEKDVNEQTSFFENAQNGDSTIILPSQNDNDDGDSILNSSSLLNGNGNPSSSETTKTDEERATNVTYDKFHKIRRKNY